MNVFVTLASINVLVAAESTKSVPNFGTLVVIVTVSDDASVVSTTSPPAANVKVSVVVSATTLDCPATAIVLNIGSVVLPAACLS